MLIDVDTLRHRLGDHRVVCETDTGEPLPPATVRRLACHAEIVPVVLDGAGVVLDEGRARRTASVEQRRALRAMHRSCVHPDCPVGFEHCDIHHVTLHPDRTVEWRHPDGTLHHTGPAVDVAPTGIHSELRALLGAVVDNAVRRARATGPPSRAPAA